MGEEELLEELCFSLGGGVEFEDFQNLDYSPLHPTTCLNWEKGSWPSRKRGVTDWFLEPFSVTIIIHL